MADAPVRLTKSLVAAASCPPDRDEVFIWDASVRGFGVRIRSSGRKSWIAQHRDGQGRTRRITIADVQIVELEDARRKARAELARAALGEDVNLQKRAARNALKVAKLVESYLEASKTRVRPSTYDQIRVNLQKHAAPLHAMAVTTVGRADIVKLLDNISKNVGGVAANRTRANLHAMFVWALKTGAVDMPNPVAATPTPTAEKTRDRVLSDDELKAIWEATGRQHDFDRIVRVLMLTACRRDEVSWMAWPEISGELWTLPGDRTKNHQAHEVFLTALARSQLPAPREKRALVFGEGEGGFSGFASCKAALDERIAAARAAAEGREPAASDALPNWTLHDLRRTAATWLSENGTEPHIVEAVLNHMSGAAKRGVAGVYNRAVYRAPKRAAWELWEAHIRKLVGVQEPETAPENAPGEAEQPGAAA